MRRRTLYALAASALIAAATAWHFTRRQDTGIPDAITGQTASITIDYPAEGSVYPPDFAPPTFIWRDPDDRATVWQIRVTFTNGSREILLESPGDRMSVGEIDPRCVSPTNRLPELTPAQAQARIWKPDAGTWTRIQRASVESAATVTVSGFRDRDFRHPLSTGRVTIQTSQDPVGAPIFYRDVPLMPSETERGVIKPLAGEAVPLIAWRLRDVAESDSRILMEGLYTCANCHSFSNDGKTMGMDVDGPQNDKGLYALAPIRARMSIGSEEVIAWSTFRGKLGGRLRVGFMSQVSPDGKHVVTTINDPGVDQTQYQRRMNPRDLVQNYYVANFRDYRFLQVFYPTRGILAWYGRAAGRLQPLPGADDGRFVHTNAVWSPDGTYLVFSRSASKDAYPGGGQLAEYANDPKETRIQYDLYRIPFNEGRGGRPEPIAGASRNGMSNTFPKISPDGRWIVYVQCGNGQLMRPDSQLYIVPASGGTARRMCCNTPLMNSWHSFSPNGRWLVFSSKSRSPYTQMFLTHLDEEGNDSPAILIEDATAANRAVNIPEFVNIAPEGLVKIEAPITEYYRTVDNALTMMKEGRYQAVIPEWRKALELSSDEPLAHNNLGVALAETGQVDEAITHYRRALELDPKYPEAYNNLGEALAGKGALDQARTQFSKALELDGGHAEAQSNLGAVLAQQGRTDEAIPHLERAARLQPEVAHVRKNLGLALATRGRYLEAVPHLEEGVRLSGGQDPTMLDLLSRVYAKAGRLPEALQAAHRALEVAARQNNQRLVEALKTQIQAYASASSARKR